MLVRLRELELRAHEHRLAGADPHTGEPAQRARRRFAAKAVASRACEHVVHERAACGGLARRRDARDAETAARVWLRAAIAEILEEARSRGCNGRVEPYTAVEIALRLLRKSDLGLSDVINGLRKYA